jgi:hypothetical protein
LIYGLTFSASYIENPRVGGSIPPLGTIFINPFKHL